MARIRFDILSTGGIRRSFPVREGACVIGRSVQADIRIALPSVFPRHATVEAIDGGHLLRPCRADAEVLVNGDPVAEEGRRLAIDDIVQVGPTRLRVMAEAPSAAAIEVKSGLMQPKPASRTP